MADNMTADQIALENKAVETLLNIIPWGTDPVKNPDLKIPSLENRKILYDNMAKYKTAETVRIMENMPYSLIFLDKDKWVVVEVPPHRLRAAIIASAANRHRIMLKNAKQTFSEEERAAFNTLMFGQKTISEAEGTDAYKKKLSDALSLMDSIANAYVETAQRGGEQGFKIIDDGRWVKAMGANKGSAIPTGNNKTSALNLKGLNPADAKLLASLGGTTANTPSPNIAPQKVAKKEPSGLTTKRNNYSV